MRLPPTPRVRFLRELAQELRQDGRAGRVIVAVDGGPGGVAFADDLAAVFEEAGADAFRASMTGFHRSRADRTRLGPETLEGYYRGAYDEVTFRRVLLDPFRLGGSTGFQTAAFDEVRDAPAESRWLTAGPDAVLVLDGEFLLRPTLRDEWNSSVLLVDAPQNPAYLADANPAAHAGALVDESDPALPVRVDAADG
jgi:uridine kinase